MVGKCRYSGTVYGAIVAIAGYPQSIVELGCGIGANIDRFRECPKKIGIDPNPANVKCAKEMFPWNDYVCADYKELAKYRDDEFDVAFTVSVLDHIRRFGDVIRELDRVSKVAVFVEPMIEGQERKARKHETFRYKDTWYHDYRKEILNQGKHPIIHHMPLYDLNSGHLFKVIVV